jgi:hypothetical protein
MKDTNKEHPLFRACMQTIVAIEQQWRQKEMIEQANRLREAAYKYVGANNGEVKSE